MITLLVTIVVLGVALYLIETYVPMSAPLKTLLRVVVVLAVVIWLLQAFGLMSGGFPRFSR